MIGNGLILGIRQVYLRHDIVKFDDHLFLELFIFLGAAPCLARQVQRRAEAGKAPVGKGNTGHYVYFGNDVEDVVGVRRRTIEYRKGSCKGVDKNIVLCDAAFKGEPCTEKV